MTAAAPFHPSCTTSCVDCGVGTITLGEWYMVKDEVWERAWCGRRKSWHGRVSGQEILCIGCLEHRIGRTLIASDFTDAPVNDPDSSMSARLRNRVTAIEDTTGDMFGRGRRAWLDGRHTP
jgi:hypothetical protein